MFQHMSVERVDAAGSALAVVHRPPVGRGSQRRAVLLLHGWPGTHADWSPVLNLLAASEQFDQVDLLLPDLRGYGSSDKPAVDHDSPDPYRAYTPAAHASQLEALLDQFGTEAVLVGGYDIGANVAQLLAHSAGTRVSGLVLCDPVHPAARAAGATMNLHAETWYQVFHRLRWAPDLVAHDRATVETYLRHFYTHWWGSGAVDERHFQLLVDQYALPGAFEASIAWYRARPVLSRDELARIAAADLLRTPTEVLWGERDPVTVVAFADLLDRSFADFHLTRLPDTGHFVPLEAPDAVAAAFKRLAARVWP